MSVSTLISKTMPAENPEMIWIPGGTFLNLSEPIKKVPPGIQIISGFSAGIVFEISVLTLMLDAIGLGSGFWHEIDRRASRNQLLPLGAFLELVHSAMGMLHYPPAHVFLVDRFTLLRVVHQVRDA